MASPEIGAVIGIGRLSLLGYASTSCPGVAACDPAQVVRLAGLGFRAEVAQG